MGMKSKTYKYTDKHIRYNMNREYILLIYSLKLYKKLYFEKKLTRTLIQILLLIKILGYASKKDICNNLDYCYSNTNNNLWKLIKLNLVFVSKKITKTKYYSITNECEQLLKEIDKYVYECNEQVENYIFTKQK